MNHLIRENSKEVTSIMSKRQQQQQRLKEKPTVSNILHTYGKQFTQIRERYADGGNGRCAVGVIMSYYGWDGSDNFNAVIGSFGALGELKFAGIDEDLLIDLNDSGLTFDEIADHIDLIHTADTISIRQYQNRRREN
jgi:hypothetical protein